MKMQSNDNYITVEMFNDGIQEIKSEIVALNKMIDGVQNEIKDTRNELLTEIRLNQHDVAHLQTSVYWGFAIIAFVVAFISLNPFRREKTENATQQKETLTEARVEKIAETIAEKVISKALAGISR